VDGTTEVAALVVMAAGVLAGIGAYRLASGIIALTTLLLVEKSRLHALAASIDDVGLQAGVRFAVMALVVLPLLPQGPWAPWRRATARELWALVLFFSGLSFVGFIARRMVGPGHGYFITGLLGGLVSSTNVTSPSRARASAEPASARARVWGRGCKRRALSACWSPPPCSTLRCCWRSFRIWRYPAGSVDGGGDRVSTCDR
jgi:uncharacterized membrane protein (DUF4010 family)